MILLGATVSDHQLTSLYQVPQSPMKAVQFVLHSRSLMWPLAVINVLQ